jgi:hypothetical protein
VSFLASCRRDWLIDAAVLGEMRSRTTDLTGLTIAEAEGEFAWDRATLAERCIQDVICIVVLGGFIGVILAVIYHVI